jgi:ribonuclease HII
LTACGMGLVAGVDEAGRGPLAGPVVAGAVILRADRIPPGIKDSKQLSAPARRRAFDDIMAAALAVGVGVIPPEVIDHANIVGATLQAMAEAVRSLGLRPDCVVVDGRDLPDLPVPVIGLIKGDARCVSVAAASILAKVTRDHIMLVMDTVYPQYALARNKGYGTRDHIEALRRYGPTRIHRFSFEPVLASLGARIAE